MSFDKAAKAIGLSVCSGVFAGGWMLLAAVTGKDLKDTYTTAEKVPSLYTALNAAKANEIPADHVAVPTTLARARLWRKLPSVSKLEGDMLTLAVFAEAGNQPKEGIQAVAAAILNRTGTKHGLTLAEVIRSPRQFSFVNVTTIGKLVGRNSQEAIEFEAAKPQYNNIRQALNGMIDPKTGAYLDYAAGTDFYYNPTASSKEGAAWFRKNTVPVIRVGAHFFCKLKQG
jgi:spore germination cell wall hydrolase CwlJ-like protein